MPTRGEGTRNKRAVGSLEEDEASSFLIGHGCTMIDKNFSCKAGEIDLIYLDSDGSTICFGEVKFRKGSSSGDPEEAVTNKKQRKICLASDYYRMKNGLDESLSYRYDVIAVTPGGIRWHKNAFEYR